ncbi:hypothetical protein [Lentzea flava]|uniref:DUF47 family protein n=1 Tax=Lentzea flava TaxID=103732 RepID=A0ABQ2URQ8_9PSEU|nr:hypothetical protein [Lentzea flava]MCP2201152.1 hypothetical protein [Lentzea flava]GGU48448.1 hypothetical protein GCM10010178_46500 [Lentzea flava]
MTGQILRHACHIEAVRVRFAAVHRASAVVVGDETVYGRLCRWIIGLVLEKHVRQDELVSYVEENLRLIVAGLCDLAGEKPPEPDPVREAAVPSLIAPARETASSAMEQIGPLRDVLDELTGLPDVIAAHATTWWNIAVEQRAMADELADFLERDVPAWDGAAEHQRLMGHNIDAIRGLSSVSAAFAEITESVGVLVAQTRRLVRELVISLVVAPSDVTFQRLTCRIAVYGVALNATLTHLENRLEG